MRVDENPQKRQVRVAEILLVVLSCVFGGCVTGQVEELQRSNAPSCDQTCGTVLDERTFFCIDRCQLDSERDYRR
jgi:hypothetical protein